MESELEEMWKIFRYCNRRGGEMASEVDPYTHGDNSSSDLKVRPPNSNSNLVIDSEKCIDKDKRGNFWIS